MTKKYVFRKGLVIGIIILFVGAIVAPCINGTISKMSGFELNKKTLNQELPSTEQIPNSFLPTGDENSSSLAFHTFDETGEKQQNVVLPKGEADKIIDILEELKYKIVYEPRSEETQALKNEFVDLLDAYGLIPAGLSKSYVLSLLNPSWLNNKQKTSMVRTRTLLLKSFTSRIIEKIAYLQQIFKNRFGITILKNFDKNTMITPSYADTATATFCSISSGGNGATLPLFLLPRPRGVAVWSASLAVTLVGELLTGKGFTAGGAQSGTALGFMGLGLTYAFPGYTMYGFVGYALYTKVNAESIEYFEPPNQAPIISNENPANGAKDVSLSLFELSFRISDPDGDQMDYTVTTEPDIGSGSGNNKQGGVYSVPISGLESDIFYRWTVEVTDDKDTTIKDFSFATEAIPFDPFDEGWNYRKQITIDHTKVDGNLIDFPILVSTVDSDILDKAQYDGDDILFMDDTGVANKVYHEIEYYNGNNGELVAWVKIPEVDDSSDTVFYMYYGNPSCGGQQCPEWVWDSDYVMVQHMVGSDNMIYDSTINNNDGTIHEATGTNGVIGPALHFDGDDDYVSCPPNDVFDMDFPVTLEAWIYKEPGGGWDDDGFDGIIITDRYSSGYSGYNMELRLKQGDLYGFSAQFGNGKGGASPKVRRSKAKAEIIELYSYYKVTGVIKGINDFNLFVNGQDVGGDYSGDANTVGYHGGPCVIGNSWYFDYNFHGMIDEVRVSKTARSSAWISTEYNNQNDPSCFLSFGPEET